MKYKYSKVDEDNRKWFANDMSKATLSEIGLRQGVLRGVHPFNIEFTYPISVIAGKNRSGKSTILAMAACAFHNRSDGFKLPERKLSYYTFSDFFVQTTEEVPPDGIEIWYKIRHNRWKKSPRTPNGVGNSSQNRIKKKGGKWNNYSSRVSRNVIFLGIQRVVPHSEKTVSKSYRAHFVNGDKVEWEDDVRKVVGKILGTVYDSFRIKTHSKYHMPLVTTHGNIYSGFNMGAGENTLFEIFSTIYTCPPGALLIVDEIELGLHEDAQKKLIAELKTVCNEQHMQVICTTHSPAILETVPPEARFFVESYPSRTVIINGISPQYAAGILSDRNSDELNVYVEDNIAEGIVMAVIDCETRKRISVIPIGSASAVLRQMAARYKDRRNVECLAILDGDQSVQSSHVDLFLSSLETKNDSDKATDWLKDRLAFLPGDTWPERWVMQELINSNLNALACQFKITPDDLSKCVETASTSDKHNELYSLSQSLSLDEQLVWSNICLWIVNEKPEEFLYLKRTIDNLLQ
jgi:predicted ATPase